MKHFNLTIKLLCIVVSALLILSLSACGGSESESVNTSPEAGNSSEEPTTVAEDSNDITQFIEPQIEDDGTDGTYLSDTLYLYNNVAYNIFGSNEATAKNYSESVNSIADSVGDNVKVYNIVVPNHTEFGLPPRLADETGCTSQAENIKTIMENLNSRVQPINCYNALSTHNDEYIYFATDHHWTSLGAYYGYEAFCEQTNQTPLDITALNKNTITGFTGSFYTLTDSPTLYENSDTVAYYDLPNNTSAVMKESMDSEPLEVDVYYPAPESGSLTYSLFCWGDTAQFVISSDAGTGKKIAVIKDSYGNAFAPYLTANYDEVHLLDFRYFTLNLNDYLIENGIEEVIILNNTMSANTPSQVATMVNNLS